MTETDAVLKSFAFALLLGALLVFPASWALVSLGLRRRSFQGKELPTGLGIVFLPAVLLACSISLRSSSPYTTLPIPVPQVLFLLAVLSLGLLDDIFGSREEGGLTGHLKALLLHGKVTTGFIKAAGILAASFLLFFFQGPLSREVWIQILLVPLMANAMNLLDTRPGRAGIVFLVLQVAPVPFLLAGGLAQKLTLHPFSLLLASSVAGYLPFDLGRRVMMGDAGSNLLGAALGIYMVELLSPWGQAALLACLVMFHLVTEKYSLNSILEKQS